MQDVEEAVPRVSTSDQSRRRSQVQEDNKGLSHLAGSEELSSNSSAPLSAHSLSSTGKPRIDEPPKSRGLPLTVTSSMTAAYPHSNSTHREPRLIHPLLLKVPLQLRFGVNGLICNVLFVVVYNSSVSRFKHIAASTIYSLIYLVFIPLGHALASVLVFGWPERYVANLLSNSPIGLSALAIGSVMTAYLDKIEFNLRIEDYIRENFTFSRMPGRRDDEKSEFYSSLLVLVVTSLWTYVLSVYVNTPPTKSEKKEL